MSSELKEFAKRDAGFREFYRRYVKVTRAPEVREEYLRWLNEEMRQRGMLEAAWEDGQGALQPRLDALEASKTALEADLAEERRLNADQAKEIANKDKEIADQAKEITDKDKEITELRRRLEEKVGGGGSPAPSGEGTPTAAPRGKGPRKKTVREK